MIDIYAQLDLALKDKRITELVKEKDIGYLHLTNPEAPYIEYMVYNDEGVLFSEDEVNITRFNIQIDIFSRYDPRKITEMVRTVLEEKGYSYLYKTPDLYEADTELYHKPLRFSFDILK